MGWDGGGRASVVWEWVVVRWEIRGVCAVAGCEWKILICAWFWWDGVLVLIFLMGRVCCILRAGAAH